MTFEKSAFNDCTINGIVKSKKFDGKNINIEKNKRKKMFYFGVICIWVYKSISELHENRELINCNASSAVNKKGGGKKLQKAANNSE